MQSPITLTLLFILPFLCSAHPDHSNSYQEPSYPAQYEYSWAVKDYDLNYGQNEARDGSQTSGRYFVTLPDGRTQIVEYTVDGYNGYVAKVSYEGEAKPYSGYN